MGAVYFYHLTRQSIETALLKLLEKALEQGWRVEVRMSNECRLSWLDEKLWLGPDETFLPHGIEGGEHDDLQPILLTTHPAKNVQCVMSVDGAEISPSEIFQKERVCILFDGNIPEEVDTARRTWKSLVEAGCEAKYWSEESGRWEKNAEVNTTLH